MVVDTDPRRSVVGTEEEWQRALLCRLARAQDLSRSPSSHGDFESILKLMLLARSEGPATAIKLNASP